MKKTEILVIDNNEKTLQAAVSLVNSNEEWNGTGASTDEDAIEKFHQRSFDLVLLAENLGGQEDKKLRKIFTHQHSDVLMMQYGTGNADALKHEIGKILAAGKDRQKPSFSFTDDIFRPKVTIQ